MGRKYVGGEKIMNVLEHRIVKIISGELIENPFHCYLTDDEMIYKVRLVTNCYGVEETTTQYFNIKQWEDIKERGYYLA